MHGKDTSELNAMQWQQTVAGMRPHSESTVLFKCDFPVHFMLFMGGTEPQTSFMQHTDVKVSSQCDARLTLQPFQDHHEHVPMTQAARVPNRQWHQPQPRPKNPVGQKEPEPTTSEDHPENIPTNERALCDSGIQRCRQPEKEREKLSDERIDPSSTSSKGKRNLVGPCAQVWGCQCKRHT